MRCRPRTCPSMRRSRPSRASLSAAYPVTVPWYPPGVWAAHPARTWLVVPVVPASLRPRVALRAAAALLAVGGFAVPGAAAHANPTPAELSQQLSAASQQLETVIEQYNATQVRLAGTQARRDAMTAQLAPLGQTITALQDQIGRYSAGLYERIGGGPVAALVAAGSPGALLDQLTMLDH